MDSIDLAGAWHALEQAAPYVLAILVALTALAHTFQSAARALQRWAATTPAKWDDEAAARFVRFADALATVLDWIGALLPRIGFGRRSSILLVAFVLTSSTTLACGSSAGAALAGQSTPQSLGFRIHASEGSTIIIGGAYECRELEPPAEGEARSPHRCEPREGEGASVQFWLDGRSGGASTDQEISGPNISTLLKLLAQVPVSTGGAASTGGQSQSDDGDDGGSSTGAEP
ncbi:MAG: hypothetical protein K8H88_14210 [Sandaracinaceae bacterium]|nr:hypothetical protein [Sandaracinaceae bacterium]